MKTQLEEAAEPIFEFGDYCSIAKKVINIDTGEIYESAITASKVLGVSRKTICNWCNKTYKGLNIEWV